MRDDGTHLPSVHETLVNRIHRVFLKLRGSCYTWWNKRRFGQVGRDFYAPDPIHVVNGKNIVIGDNVFIGKNAQLYAYPEGCIIIGNDTSIDRNVEIRGGKRIQIGNRVRIVKGAAIKAAPNSQLIIGDRTLISQGCILDGDMRVGEDVIFGPQVFINEVDHGFDTREIPMNQQTGAGGTIIIGNDVWLGYSAVILKGVNIGRGAIIGAQAVVNRSVDSYAIQAGVPAKFIKYRNE